MSNKAEYIKGMERLLVIMPKKKLQKHLMNWMNRELTLNDKLFEVRLLLVVWDK